MSVFDLLRFMGTPKAEIETPPSPKLSDPLGTAITRAMIAAKLWDYDTQLGVERDGRKVGLNIFHPEASQADREVGRLNAIATKELLREILQAEGCTRVFIDALWCERGRKGWSIVASIQDNREDRQ